MKYFKNTKFIKRDYECTNIVYCQAESKPNDSWVEIESNKFQAGITHLYSENNVKYYGYL